MQQLKIKLKMGHERWSKVRSCKKNLALLGFFRTTQSLNGKLGNFNFFNTLVYAKSKRVLWLLQNRDMRYHSQTAATRCGWRRCIRLLAAHSLDACAACARIQRHFRHSPNISSPQFLHVLPRRTRVQNYLTFNYHRFHLPFHPGDAPRPSVLRTPTISPLYHGAAPISPSRYDNILYPKSFSSCPTLGFFWFFPSPARSMLYAHPVSDILFHVILNIRCMPKVKKK